MSPAAFVAAVDRSFLPKKEKADLRRMAEGGLAEKDWKQLNERLIRELVRRESMQRQSSRKIDQEIDRFTAEYEREKSVIDRQFRDTLAKAEESEKDRLWEEYRGTIRELQNRLLKEVAQESTTILHDVALMTAAAQADET